MAWVTVVPGGPGDLRHGYTLADIQRIAVSATRAAGRMAANFADRLDTAWSAIADLLYSAEHPPPEHDLWHAGRDAIWASIRDDRHHHGAQRDDWGSEPGSMRKFARYWWEHATPTPSCESRIVEREALAQIWPQLTSGDRRALLAVAAHGNAEAAAKALGIGQRALLSRLNSGRRHFRRLWHEGETPSRKWRVDGPLRSSYGGRELRPCGTIAAYARHKRRGEPVDDLCQQEYLAESRRYRSLQQAEHRQRYDSDDGEAR